MRIVVASHNPVKVEAAHGAFSAVFPGRQIEVVSVAVESGVADQPMSDAETRDGARNRVRGARKGFPEADFWVGLEGGLDVIDGELFGVAWMAVGGAGERITLARTPTLPIPPAARQLVEQGLELGDANDRVFATLNSKQRGGAFGLLTEGRHTRGSIYAMTLELALVPWAHELWCNDAKSEW